MKNRKPLRSPKNFGVKTAGQKNLKNKNPLFLISKKKKKKS